MHTQGNNHFGWILHPVFKSKLDQRQKPSEICCEKMPTWKRVLKKKNIGAYLFREYFTIVFMNI